MVSRNAEEASVELTGESFACAQMLARRTLFALCTQSVLLHVSKWTHLAMN